MCYCAALRFLILFHVTSSKIASSQIWKRYYCCSLWHHRGLVSQAVVCLRKSSLLSSCLLNVTLSQSAEDTRVSLVSAFPQVTGVALLAVGLWWKFMLGPYMLLISNTPSNAPYVLAGTGVAIVLFGLFGCFATCKGRPWMLKLVSHNGCFFWFWFGLIYPIRCHMWIFGKCDWTCTVTMSLSESYSVLSLSPQYAIFLCLVFMTELIAGISGFIFRHEVTAAAPPPPPDSHTSTETTRLC